MSKIVVFGIMIVDTVADVESFPAVGSVISFLDHLCHPISLLMYLAGMPDSFSYERSRYGAGIL